jgi:hypothetical protein
MGKCENGKMGKWENAKCKMGKYEIFFSYILNRVETLTPNMIVLNPKT